MNNLSRKDYERLTQAKKEQLLLDIAAKHPQFSLLRFEHFSRFGMELYTGIYLFEEEEFVFVPGDQVTLGWDSFVEGMNEETRSNMEEGFLNCTGEKLDLMEHLKKNTTPVRSASIQPMLVERTLNEIGWDRVPLDSEELAYYAEDIEEFKNGSHLRMTMYKNFRLRKSMKEGIIAELYYLFTYEDLIDFVESREGFSLPTEDEWEYLCGGGKRTLFRWGDSFDFEMKLLHYPEIQESNAPFTLTLPNQFGISIAYNPYKYEVLKSPTFLKGADGGSNICGGMGIGMGYLPIATYYKGCQLEDPTIFKTDIGGDYTTYRRVFRLG